MMIYMIEQYHEIEASLQDADSQYNASGCQGVICGMLVFDSLSSLSRWIDETIDELDTAYVDVPNVRHILTELSVFTQQRLKDPGMSFELLLPEEDQTPLKLRVAALSDWCEGFLYGLSLAGVNDKTRLPGDSSELINDVLEISRVALDSTPDEAHEAAYFELVEYLRVAVLLLAEEFQSLQHSKRV